MGHQIESVKNRQKIKVNSGYRLGSTDEAVPMKHRCFTKFLKLKQLILVMKLACDYTLAVAETNVSSLVYI